MSSLPRRTWNLAYLECYANNRFSSSTSRFQSWAACGDLPGNQNERRRRSGQRQILVSHDCTREDCSGSLWHENWRWIQVFINSHLLQKNKTVYHDTPSVFVGRNEKNKTKQNKIMKSKISDGNKHMKELVWWIHERVIIQRILPFFLLLDVNECNSTIPVCDANAECENTIGSHRCSCKAGFPGNGKTCVGKLVK